MKQLTLERCCCASCRDAPGWRSRPAAAATPVAAGWNSCFPETVSRRGRPESATFPHTETRRRKPARTAEYLTCTHSRTNLASSYSNTDKSADKIVSTATTSSAPRHLLLSRAPRPPLPQVAGDHGAEGRGDHSGSMEKRATPGGSGDGGPVG